MSQLAVHTDAPLMPLTRMVSGTALITRHHDRHVITGLDEDSVHWVATTLKILGHQVAVVEERH